MASWRQVVTANAPSPRGGALIQRDEITDDILLFGGFNSSAVFQNDTWVFSGGNWTQLFPTTTTPPAGAPPYQCDIGWDGINGKPMLLFKQTIAPNFRFFHFDWGAPDWVEIFPATVPADGFTFDTKLAWFPPTGKMYLFAGSGGTAWEWDGTDFTDLGVPVAGFDYGATFTYDPRQQLIVQYGGTVPPATLTDTITFDGTTFTVETPASNPGRRADAPARWAAYSSSCRGVIVYGGDDSADTNTTYGYLDRGGYDWFNMAPATHPDAIHAQAMCTDSKGRVFMFGGYGPGVSPTYYDETWVFTCPQFKPQIYRRPR